MSQQDIFKALREQRAQGVQPTNEEATTDKEETKGQGSGQQRVDEEETVLACPHCGIIGSIIDEGVTECPFCGEEELLEKTVKVVRNGKVVTKKKPTKKKRLTAAQKQALAKARKKAHTASANKARQKSMKVRRRSVNDEDTYECPECGFSGEYDDFDEEDGSLYCPECGAEVDLAEACAPKKKPVKKKKVNEEVDDLRAMLEEVGASDFMMQKLEEGRLDMVKRYLDIKMGE